MRFLYQMFIQGSDNLKPYLIFVCGDCSSNSSISSNVVDKIEAGLNCGGHGSNSAHPRIAVVLWQA